MASSKADAAAPPSLLWNASPPPPSRVLCLNCHRPALRLCLCHALPPEPLVLKRSHVVVLQHPREANKKNRSLPIVEKCFDDISVVVGRRFATTDGKQAIFSDSSNPVWLVYPHAKAISLSQAIQQLPSSDATTVTLVFLDATWKFAKEMHRANLERQAYPPHLQYIQLTEEDLRCASNNQPAFEPRRFAIRSMPQLQQQDNEFCMSTAECIARTVALVEENPDLFHAVIKPLDCMVEQWQSFRTKESQAEVASTSSSRR